MLYFWLASCTFVARLPVSPAVSLLPTVPAVLFLSASASYVFTSVIVTGEHGAHGHVAGQAPTALTVRSTREEANKIMLMLEKTMEKVCE
jgi:hypothetical protein